MNNHLARPIHAAVAITDGCEEMEAVICIDVLRRAGWKVESIGLTRDTVMASRGVRLIPDSTWHELNLKKLDVLVIPGGIGGTERMMQNPVVLNTIHRFSGLGQWLAAVCAGPLVLQEAGVLDGRKVTCHPSVAGRMKQAACTDASVVVDRRLITSQGPGTSMEFALRIVSEVESPEAAKRISEAMVHSAHK